jgi:hypothetical protein
MLGGGERGQQEGHQSCGELHDGRGNRVGTATAAATAMAQCSKVPLYRRDVCMHVRVTGVAADK